MLHDTNKVALITSHSFFFRSCSASKVGPAALTGPVGRSSGGRPRATLCPVGHLDGADGHLEDAASKKTRSSAITGARAVSMGSVRCGADERDARDVAKSPPLRKDG